MRQLPVCVQPGQLSLPSWLEYDFGPGNDKIVNGYTIIAHASQVGGWNPDSYNPKTWTFEGHDGAAWIVLHSVADGGLLKNVAKEFTFANTTAYQRYRISITASNGSPTWTHITELELRDGGNDNDGDGVFAQKFNADGSEAVGVFQVNTHIARDQRSPRVAIAPDGARM